MNSELALDATARAAASGDFVDIASYSRGSDAAARNEFLLFFKPELTAPIERLGRVWDVVQGALARFDCEIVAAAACGARYLQRHRIFEQHYGVINQISTRGLAAVTETGRTRIEQLFRQEGRELEVLGGHQFLERFPTYTAESLAELHDSKPLHRFAGGTHGVIVSVDGRDILLLDGFHPLQLEEYYTEGRSILNLVLRSPARWKSLRQELTGVTNPSKADPDSIRGLLLRQKDVLGLPEVSPMHNGVHLSAGPVEAIVEISRFMSDHDRGVIIAPEDTTLGHELARAGGPDLLAALCANVDVRYDSASESVFDLTEEWDSSTLLSAVSERSLVPLAG
ncbi:MAG TPA: hypothetical protein VGO86_03810 [Candidatus Dormibacteraeota bacterium]